MLAGSGDCFTAVSGGDEEESSIRKSKQKPEAGRGDIRPTGSAADRCREGGVDSGMVGGGAWEETLCFFCMTHENIMNSSQVQTHIHT